MCTEVTSQPGAHGLREQRQCDGGDGDHLVDAVAGDLLQHVDGVERQQRDDRAADPRDRQQALQDPKTWYIGMG